MIQAKLIGAAALSAKFRKLEQAVQKQVLEQALIAGALVVQNEWKMRTPYKTGTYRRSIHIGGHTDLASDFRAPREKGACRAPAGARRDLGARSAAGTGQARVIVGTNLTDPPYPVFLEEGTSKMSARPSAGPAFDAKKDEAVKEIGEAFREIVSKLT